jgi:hypothetical protein
MAKAAGNGREMASATQMAAHLCFDRSMLDKLVAQGVLVRRADGRWPVDDTRGRYIRHLREVRRLSPRSAADAEFTKAKAELIAIRIGERKKELMLASECYALQDEMFGLFMTHLSALPAKIGGRDMTERRKVEKAIFDMRTELANEAEKRAKLAGEPDLPTKAEAELADS